MCSVGVDGRARRVFSRRTGSLLAIYGSCNAGMAREYSAGSSRGPGWRESVADVRRHAGISMAPRSWAIGTMESCSTDMMTDGSKSGRVATIHE